MEEGIRKDPGACYGPQDFRALFVFMEGRIMTIPELEKLKWQDQGVGCIEEFQTWGVSPIAVRLSHMRNVISRLY